MSTRPTPTPEITPEIFFHLVDEVLISLGRSSLEESPAHRLVIEVRPSDRVLQILAGPGSGKTEALVWRVLYELFVLRTAAAKVIVTTFTKRAATELQIRVVERCDEFLRCAVRRGLGVSDPQVHNLRVGTIHSLCDSLLAEFDANYMEAGTQVIDEAETAIRLARCYRYALGFTNPPASPKVINRLIGHEPLVALFKPPWEDRWPSRMMEVVDFVGNLIAQHTETWVPRCSRQDMVNGIERIHNTPGLTADLRTLHQRWEEYLTNQNVLDFAMLQKHFLDRQDSLIGKFDHILVDEFQDSNPIQFALHARWLENTATRLTVVGDDDQAIYRFRGSDIECFRGLKPHCETKAIGYRSETLGVNFRSSRNIVSFTEAFKSRSVLRQISMPKTILAGPKAEPGVPVRLLIGNWENICAAVASEIDRLGAGRPPIDTDEIPSVAYLSFSTSEREYRNRPSPTLAVRRALESRGIRVYNPRNKTAGTNDSPVAMLFGLISYLIDPVSMAPGKTSRGVEVWGSLSDRDAAKQAHARRYARSASPSFPINDRHAALQKAFIKGDGGKVGSPAASRAPILAFVDDIRARLVALPAGSRGRLTLSGFVARLLAFPLFRHTGFTLSLFRQALFTQLLEANIAPTRLTRDPLDQPLEVTLQNGKFVWPDRYWNLLSIFGGYLDNTNLDDPEIEAFEEDAVLMITFHQAKGLEFDHVYIAATGRTPDIGPALRTGLFSGQPISYTTIPQLQTTDAQTQVLAMADREREVYVAMTRPRHSLTILHDPSIGIDFFGLNPAIEDIFRSVRGKRHPGADVEMKEYSA